MRSSTSSSSHRRERLRIAAACVAVLVGGLLGLRCFTGTLRWIVPEPFGLGRVQQGIDALPGVATHPGPTVVVFGSSKVHLGFAPSVFDARLRELGREATSFNLGFGNLNPSLQLRLARRVRAAFERSGRRIDLLLVEFTPFQATRTRRRMDAKLREQFEMLLWTWPEILAEVLRSPERGIRYAAGRLFRGGIAPEAVTAVFQNAVHDAGEGGRPDDGERFELLLGAYRALREIHGGQIPLWDGEARGGFDVVFPETREAVAALAVPGAVDDLQYRIDCCDILELRFDESLVADFVALVRELAAVSERVEVVLMPENPVVPTTPAGEARLAAVVERIGREPGVPVADLRAVPGIDASRFFDTTHLTPHEGAPEFSRWLAERYADSLPVTGATTRAAR